MDDTTTNGATPPAEAVEHSEAPVLLPAADQTAAEPGEPPPPQSTCREAILAHLGDCAEAGPQSAASIVAILKAAGFAENTIEVGLHRSVAAGQILRTSPGFYKLKPKVAPLPPPPPPAEPRIERHDKQREKAEAAARADYALMNRLIEAAGGNILNDGDEIGAVREMMAIVPIEMVFKVLKQFAPWSGQVPPKALLNWRDPRFLRAVADEVTVSMMIPAMLKRWSEAPEARAAPQSAV